MRGKLITFEGIDKCGKSTQITFAHEYLKTKNIENIIVKDPGDTTLGTVARMILKNPHELYQKFNEHFRNHPDFSFLRSEQKRTPESELMLYLIARTELVYHVIRSALENGVSVLSDRFTDSTRAYQGAGRFNSRKDIIDFIRTSSEFLYGDCMPDKTFYFDITYDTMMERCAQESYDYLESSGREFFERARGEYIKIASEEPERVHFISGEESIEDIKIEIFGELNKIFKINS